MSTPIRTSFMTAVLGKDGAKALNKAAERSRDLGDVLLPRTILAWLHTVTTYEGTLPGVENSHISLTKTEAGFEGTVNIGDSVYKFEKADVYHTVASVAVALDFDPGKSKFQLRDADLERLGKTIDILAKARSVTKELERRATLDEEDEEDLEKVDLAPGPAHAPSAPEPAATAAPPSRAQIPNVKVKITKPKVAKPPKPIQTEIKLSQSEKTSKCSMCAGSQFDGHNFVGCICLRALAKSVTVISSGPTGAVLSLNQEDWDQEAIQTLLETVGRF